MRRRRNSSAPSGLFDRHLSRGLRPWLLSYAASRLGWNAACLHSRPQLFEHFSLPYIVISCGFCLTTARHLLGFRYYSTWRYCLCLFNGFDRAWRRLPCRRDTVGVLWFGRDGVEKEGDRFGSIRGLNGSKWDTERTQKGTFGTRFGPGFLAARTTQYLP